MLLITEPADSGNIEVVDATDPSAIRLRIREDGAAAFYQWFYFRVDGAAGQPLAFTIENAGGSSYVPGWQGYRTVVSEDGEDWVRTETSYADGQLRFAYTPAGGVCWFAYFAPYDLHRHDRLLASAAASSLVSAMPLGTSLDGQPITSLRIGEGPRQVWVIGRQHPGESMASWWMEGFVPRLLDPLDELATRMRTNCTVHVVPLMNPDGVRRGHLRTNAAGTDLNRAWSEPNQDSSPEVALVRAEMEASGCDLFLDVHGDEAIANNFIAGAEGVPSWSEAMASRQAAFLDRMLAVSPDFQTEQGYPVTPPGRADLRIATNWVAERFGALAMTLEMPFKDASVNPDPARGWSTTRCAKLGRDCLDGLAATLS